MTWLQCGVTEEYAAGIKRLFDRHSYIYKLISLWRKKRLKTVY